MLPLFWDETHHALRESTRRWVERHIRPHAREWEEEGIFPRALYAQAAEAGLIGVGYPEAYGGADGDVHHGLIVAEELVRGGSVGCAMSLGSHGIAVPPILNMGSREQKARFLPPIIRGEKIAALAITEPGAGSDVASVACRAARDGDHYVVNGSKEFITSGTRADLVTMAVRTGDPGYGGISLLVVETDSPGYSASPPLKKMGWWGSDTATLHLEDCRVPVANLLGAENMGFFGIMANFVSERLFLAATCVAMASMAIEESERYAAERRAFGKPIMAFQVTRHRLADMVTREAAARSFVATVSERHRRGEDVTADVAMLKNVAVEACSFVCDAAVQIHGGAGYMRETLVERLYRDARLFPIGGGTTEIMKEIISRRWRR